MFQKRLWTSCVAVWWNWECSYLKYMYNIYKSASNSHDSCVTTWYSPDNELAMCWGALEHENWMVPKIPWPKDLIISKVICSGLVKLGVQLFKIYVYKSVSISHDLRATTWYSQDNELAMHWGALEHGNQIVPNMSWPKDLVMGKLVCGSLVKLGVHDNSLSSHTGARLM